MKRPGTLTFVAVCLGSAAVSRLSVIREQQFSPLSDPHVIVGLIATIGAVVAGVAGFGIWRMRPWAYKAVAAFGIVIMAMLVYEETVIADAGLLRTGAVAALIAGFFAVLTRYVHWIIVECDGEVPISLP